MSEWRKGRPRTFTDDKVLGRYLALAAKLQRRPTGRELARALRLSHRSAWRYLKRLTSPITERRRRIGAGSNSARHAGNVTARKVM